MGRKVKNVLLITGIFLCILMITDSFFTESDLLSQEASAVPREFEENITIPSGQIVPLDLLFTQGDELELIFDMEVKENLPVDIWFVDYANYVRLVDGHEFLFFIDGSGKDLKKAQKVVTITLKGTYELVFANYNNDTVEVNLKYDINTYPEEKEEVQEEETPLMQEFYVIFPLGLTIGLVVGFLLAGIVRKPKKGKAKPEKEKPKKKTKKKKVKKKAPKETNSSETEDKPETVKKAPSPKFCGHCGKPVETPFCPFCGKEVSKG